MKWARFINLSGGANTNLDGDEVMEHLNKMAKGKIRMLGPNHTPEVVMRIGKTIMFTRDITKHLGGQTQVPLMSRKHTKKDLNKDMKMVVSELMERSKVFNQNNGREYPTFGKTGSNIYADIKLVELHKWLSEKKIQYSGSKWAF